MPIFDPDQLRTLAASYSALQQRLDLVAEAYAFFPYKTQQGGQYATHGFLRRFNTMHHCIERVFAMLPPEQGERPPDPVLLDATVYIQSFVMNVFGALDNLAWIWVSEKPLTVSKKQTGLDPKCKIGPRFLLPRDARLSRQSRRIVRRHHRLPGRSGAPHTALHSALHRVGKGRCRV